MSAIAEWNYPMLIALYRSVNALLVNIKGMFCIGFSISHGLALHVCPRFQILLFWFCESGFFSSSPIDYYNLNIPLLYPSLAYLKQHPLPSQVPTSKADLPSWASARFQPNIGMLLALWSSEYDPLLMWNVCCISTRQFYLYMCMNLKIPELLFCTEDGLKQLMFMKWDWLCDWSSLIWSNIFC